MPYATTTDNVRLYYEEVGSGTPILFSTSSPATTATGSRRCGFSRGGIAASPIQPRLQAVRRSAGSDRLQLQALGRATRSRSSIISRSRRCISSACRWAASPRCDRHALIRNACCRSPRRAPAPARSDSEIDSFRKTRAGNRRRFSRSSAPSTSSQHLRPGPARIPFLVKDPRGFDEFNAMFAEHDAKGAANTCAASRASVPRSTTSRRRSGRSRCRR